MSGGAGRGGRRGPAPGQMELDLLRTSDAPGAGPRPSSASSPCPGAAVASSTLPPDAAAREGAISERALNVVIDAGAGTGKTTLLVRRLVEMVAPADDGAPALAMAKLAAVTFTRKASGELRLRIRERLLSELSGAAVSRTRRGRLLAALGGLDTALVGTIHGFADRLLRLRPVEARLSPAYEIAEDEAADALAAETYSVLVQAAEAGTLAAELRGHPVAARADEAAATVVDALHAGLRARTREVQFHVYNGLDALIAGFIRHRDAPPQDPPPPGDSAAAPDLVSFRRDAAELVARVETIDPAAAGDGTVFLRRAARRARHNLAQDDPLVLLREVVLPLADGPRDLSKARAFDGDDTAWNVWRAFAGDERKTPVRATPLRADLAAPLLGWMARRLVRLFPVVVALYERVKERRRAVDQVDLLLKLRDLLRDDLGARHFFQERLDHVFVDELQDTDPLQAEVLLFLCEHAPAARSWEDVVLAPGKLTIVGDPKQSIYRFRRADIGMYAAVRRLLTAGPHHAVDLAANFRSAPPLVDWLNDRFTRVLGAPPAPGVLFDPHDGRAFQQALLAGRTPDAPGPAVHSATAAGHAPEADAAFSSAAAPVPASAAHVHVLPLEPAGDKPLDADFRALEAEALAHYLRWLVERSGFLVRDALSDARRAASWGDVAVLTLATTTLAPLFPWLDRLGVPWTARGGALFLTDPLHQQLLLALRAVADTGDGIAQAALWRPPFFAVDLGELARARAAEPPTAAVAAARARIAVLRRDRFTRSPGATARDLVETTGFARAVAGGPNGAQRLARVRELCLVLDQLAAREGLDYDAVTARLRGWLDAPPALDAPPPVGREAVQVLTVHQAKGLEFPVVALWDGRTKWRNRDEVEPWCVARGGTGWAVQLDRFRWEEPRGGALAATEERWRDAERRRVVYVAATRARDLLVVASAGRLDPERLVAHALLAGDPPPVVCTLAPWRAGAPPPWASPDPAAAPAAAAAVAAAAAAAAAADDDDAPVALGDPAAPIDEAALAARWEAAADAAVRPRLVPRPVTVATHGSAPAPSAPIPRSPADAAPALREDDESDAAARRRDGRFGPRFGETVHRAIGLALRALPETLDPLVAVRRAARRTALAAHLEEAAADVTRARRALEAEGLWRAPGPDLRLEYAVAGPAPTSGARADAATLLVGYVDLLATAVGRLDVVDFKTDPPPAPGESAATRYPHYAAQVNAYAALLVQSGVGAGRMVRRGLLFTAEGGIRWVE
jgi:ATP-dependent exoDNAse (exonuclease V) beta subunit